MSEQAAQALWERLQSDLEFRRKLEEAPTREEKKQIVHSAGLDDEISDDELDKIAGGGSLPRPLFYPGAP